MNPSEPIAPRPPSSYLAGAASDPIIQVRNLSKRFPRRRPWSELLRHPFRRDWIPALTDVTLDIERGEFFGLLGPNGAGKTTLFKILATLILADSGGGRVDGHDVEADPARVRDVLTPVIADERSLFWRLSALENLRLFAGLYGYRRHQGLVQARAMLEVVGLTDAGEKLVGAFSSGMKQRLLIGRALLSRPRVLLLDEPTRSLDPLVARDLRRFLRSEVAERQGCTVLLATHNADEALELCDRVGVLHRGRLLAVGTVEELSHRVRVGQYRLVARPEAREPLAALARSGRVAKLTEADADEDGWLWFELQIPGGAEAASQVVAEVVGSGAAMSRFERMQPSLADLLERIVAEGADA